MTGGPYYIYGLVTIRVFEFILLTLIGFWIGHKLAGVMGWSSLAGVLIGLFFFGAGMFRLAMLLRKHIK